jgi:glycine oxidase
VSTFDVAVVGGGLIGASIAFELATENLRVVVLDRQQPGQEASWAAAGMLSPGPLSPADEPLTPLAKESLQLYPEFVAAVEEVSGHSVGFQREGALEVFYGPKAEAQRNTLVAMHRQFGLAATPISLDEARKMERSIAPEIRAAVWLAEEATVEPRLLIEAVLAAASRRGVEIRPDCAVSALLREGDRETGRCIGVIADGKRIEARTVVLAAGCFTGTIENGATGWGVFAPTRPVRGQMLALRPKNIQLRRVVRGAHGYLVPRRAGTIVAGSTLENAGFEKHTTPEGLQTIRRAALELVPELANAEIVETWAGLRPGTPDDLPILGPTGIEGLLAATGHYRNGILLAPVTAKLIKNWIVRGNVDQDVKKFSPMRFSATKPQSLSPKNAQAIG